MHVHKFTLKFIMTLGLTVLIHVNAFSASIRDDDYTITATPKFYISVFLKGFEGDLEQLKKATNPCDRLKRWVLTNFIEAVKLPAGTPPITMKNIHLMINGRELKNNEDISFVRYMPTKIEGQMESPNIIVEFKDVRGSVDTVSSARLYIMSSPTIRSLISGKSKLKLSLSDALQPLDDEKPALPSAGFAGGSAGAAAESGVARASFSVKDTAAAGGTEGAAFSPRSRRLGRSISPAAAVAHPATSRVILPITTDTTVGQIWKRVKEYHAGEDGWYGGQTSVPLDQKAVRRILAEYEKRFKIHNLVLAAGHEDKHRRYGKDWYAVDLLRDCEQDAVLDITDKDMMQYFPDNWADIIIVDEERLMDEKVVPIVLRILKPSHQFVYPLKTNRMQVSAMPSMYRGDKYSFSEDGHWILFTTGSLNNYNFDKAFKARVEREALERMKAFYKGMVSKIEWDEARTNFVITK